MLDLDETINQNERRSPAEIIAADGEDHFRAIETQTLRDVLEGSARIIAVGGGAWTMAQNRKLIDDRGAFTVWLDAPFESCWNRIENGREARPLAPSRDLAKKLYDDRRAVYALADVRITVAADDSVEAIANRVVKEFSRHNINHPEQAETKAP